jgi:hypothetical protein
VTRPVDPRSVAARARLDAHRAAMAAHPSAPPEGVRLHSAPPPEPAPLERYANNVAVAGQGPNPREKRYRLRSGLWTRSSIPRCRKCGRVRRANVVGVRESSGVGGFSGLVTCGSVWVCPVCSSKVAARRAIEVGAVCVEAVRQGYAVGFLTKTLRHHEGQSLKLLWDSVSVCWKAVTQSWSWRESKRECGVIGYTRAGEVTVGGNGWHPHLHVLIFYAADARPEDVAAMVEAIDGTWARSAVRAGLAEPLAVGQDFRVIGAGDIARVAEYVSKVHKDGDEDVSKLGLELTWSASKKARTQYGTRSMWDVLEGALERGEVDDVKRWREFEKVSKGRRQLTWSNGLREMFALPEEVSDEEVAAEELGCEDDTVLYITARGWDQLVKHQQNLIPEILDVVERGGFSALATFLDFYGIDWVPA